MITFHLPDVAAYLAGLCTLAAFSMRRIIPLRAAGIAANCFSIAYGLLAHAIPALVLHSVLLPLNIVRLVQMVRLVRSVERAASGGPSADWLEGISKSRRYRAGQVMFEKGAVADRLFYIVSGRFRLPELGIDLGAGEILGELGIVAPENRRTQTVVCVEAAEVLTVTYDEVRQLYFQNPQFGFFLLRLIGERLHANAGRAPPS